MKHSLKYLIFSFFCATIIVAAGCGSEEKSSTVSTKVKSQTSLDSLVLNQKQLESVNVDLVSFETRSLKPIIFSNGVITLLPDSKAEVSSHIEGKVEQIFVREGMSVHKGQPILKISSFQLLELQNEFAAAQSEAEFLEIEYKRQDELRKSNIGVLAEYQSVDSKLKAAIAKEKALQNKLDLIGISTSGLAKKRDMKMTSSLVITSPIDGFVYKFNENIGSLVKPETILAEIINPDKLQADVFVYEKDADFVEEGLPVEISFVNRAIANAQGKIAYISRAIDAQNKAITLHVNFKRPNTKEPILADMNVKVKIVGVGTKTSENTLPKTAIFDDGDNKFIFCASGPTPEKIAFRKYRVEILREDEQYVQVKVLENIPSDVKIANKNVLALEAERKKNE